MTETDVQTAHGLFVYGVVPAELEPPAVPGVADAPVTTVRHGDVAAAVGRIELDRPPAGRADLTAYHAVVDALAAAGPVAPVRFGSVLVDEEQVVEEVLAPREHELGELLETLRGRSQVAVRARYVEDAVLAEILADDPRIRELNDRTRGLPEEAAWSDRVRLGELVANAVEVKRGPEADELLGLLLPFAVEHRIRRGSGLDHLLDVALLVDDVRLPRLEEVLEGYAEAVHERIRVSLTGPLPPYDFVADV
jgi:hypothetical protein